MTSDTINAMMSFVVLFMMAVTMGFFMCYFLVKKEYRKPCPPPPEPPEDNKYEDWLWQFVNEEDDI